MIKLLTVMCLLTVAIVARSVPEADNDAALLLGAEVVTSGNDPNHGSLKPQPRLPMVDPISRDDLLAMLLRVYQNDAQPADDDCETSEELDCETTDAPKRRTTKVPKRQTTKALECESIEPSECQSENEGEETGFVPDIVVESLAVTQRSRRTTD